MDVDEDCKCLRWSLNSTAKLLVMTVNRDNTTSQELWNVPEMTKMWTHPALKTDSAVFSPNGQFLATLSSVLTFNVNPPGEYQQPSVNVYGTWSFPIPFIRWIRLDPTEPYDLRPSPLPPPESFAISNDGDQVAVSLRATVDEGSRFEQITPDSSPTPIDVIRSPVDCLLQYSDDGRHLYCVTFRNEDYLELELTVYDPAQGRQHAKRSYQQYGLRSTNDFRLMLQTQDLVEFKGEYLVISFPCEPVNRIVIINRKDLRTVYSRSTYPSTKILSGRLFVDIERKTISNTPYAGGRLRLLGDPWNKSS
jgi:hypothetical protein